MAAVYLFPEAYLQATYRSLQQATPRDLRAALLPRCNTKPGRDAALRLLGALVTRDTANLSVGLRLIKQLHLTGSGSILDHFPSQSIR